MSAAPGTDPPGTLRRGLPAPLGWAVCVVLGLALGWLCRFPLAHTWLTGWVVAMEAGWAAVDPTMVDDGISIYFVLITGVWSLFAAIAVPSTMLARRWARLPAPAWWWTSAALWLIPFAVSDLLDLLG